MLRLCLRVINHAQPTLSPCEYMFTPESKFDIFGGEIKKENNVLMKGLLL